MSPRRTQRPRVARQSLYDRLTALGLRLWVIEEESGDVSGPHDAEALEKLASGGEEAEPLVRAIETEHPSREPDAGNRYRSYMGAPHRVNEHE
jgi:predicted metal-dependent phosphoesterase TrpH